MRKTNGLSLTHRLVETLGLAIITGQYVGTEFPNEAELSQQLGASRTATREAIKMLTSKGLISGRPRHGTAVSPEADWNLLDPDVLRWLLERKFSLKLMIQFTEMRLGIEPAAAALAARNADESGLASIQKALARMSDAAAGQDDALSADVAFHVAILNATKNAFYRDLHELVNTALRISIRFTNSIEGHLATLPAHQQVADAIAARDPVAAQAAMEAIIQDVLRLIHNTASMRGSLAS